VDLLFLLSENERGAVHAVAQTGRFGTVVENVSQMRVTPGTDDFGSGIAKQVVDMLRHTVLGERLIK
jgi:hypothetical protein